MLYIIYNMWIVYIIVIFDFINIIHILNYYKKNSLIFKTIIVILLGYNFVVILNTNRFHKNMILL